MDKTKRPAGAGTPDGPDNLHVQDDSFLSFLKREAETWFLHVERGGAEHWFEAPPVGLRTIEVWRHDGEEYCLRRFITFVDDPTDTPVPARPPGRGWRDEGPTPDGSRVLFVRPAKRGP